ncbi:LacI family DNA-binding transcriptional regulator [Paenibacillus sp. LHD-117]|uniref:LacI family DNA-binding transcriptional regulator n=1 Tax=Paenibacillus sp. LHD-117 TaxID=3071412 RepID=UPI0027DEE39E|nr:LacI family DNA-binding transcriptional regulator [Paenibacillus sp. LHD-117]MDQ6418415.1 LacI family DNA-binding transcriptional regulator [Paenibacillus sp. LHD-117]
MATIRDIAMKAQVSSVTVSRVLNRDQTFSVSDDTRQRILSIAEELNYKTPRERKGKHMITSSSDARIGTVIFLTEQQEEGDVYFSSIREGIEKECIAAGITTTKVMRLSQYGNPDLVINDVDGVIIIGGSLDNIATIVNQVDNVVFVDYAPDVEKFDSIIIDFERATKLVLDHLIKAGHKQIGFMGGVQSDGKDERHLNYENIMKECGIYDPKHVYIGEWTTTEGYNTMQRIIEKNYLPTAFFFASDSLAIGALRALQEAGISVPQQMAVAGFNDIPMAAFVTPSLTTVKVQTEMMGRMAVKLLLDRIGGREIPVQVTVPSKLIVRDSSGVQLT